MDDQRREHESVELQGCSILQYRVTVSQNEKKDQEPDLHRMRRVTQLSNPENDLQFFPQS